MRYFSHNPEAWDQIEQDAVLNHLGWDTDEDSRNLLGELSAVFPDEWKSILSKVDTQSAEQDYWGSFAI